MAVLLSATEKSKGHISNLECADREFHGSHFWDSPKRKFWCSGSVEYRNLKETVEIYFRQHMQEFINQEGNDTLTADEVKLYLREVGLGKLEEIFTEMLFKAQQG